MFSRRPRSLRAASTARVLQNRRQTCCARSTSRWPVFGVWGRCGSPRLPGGFERRFPSTRGPARVTGRAQGLAARTCDGLEIFWPGSRFDEARNDSLGSESRARGGRRGSGRRRDPTVSARPRRTCGRQETSPSPRSRAGYATGSRRCRSALTTDDASSTARDRRPTPLPLRSRQRGTSARCCRCATRSRRFLRRSRSPCGDGAGGIQRLEV